MTLKYVQPTEAISISFASLSQWQADYLNKHLHWWDNDRIDLRNKEGFDHISFSLVDEDWTVHSNLNISYEVMGQFNDIILEEGNE